MNVRVKASLLCENETVFIIRVFSLRYLSLRYSFIRCIYVNGPFSPSPFLSFCHRLRRIWFSFFAQFYSF